MKILLGLLPVFILLISLFTRRFIGRRELLKMDFVQFLYAFVFTPLIFVWFKTFVFFNLRNELGINLTVTDMFVVDTILSMLFMFGFAFIVIHSLTKTFEIRKTKDPLYDIFLHSEYFHLWLSHLIIFTATMLFIVVLAFINLVLPVSIIISKLGLYLAVVVGVILGIIFYISIWMYAPQKRNKFNKLMQFEITLSSIVLFISYFLQRPKFVPGFAIYWSVFFLFITMSCLSQIIHRSLRVQKVVSSLDQKHH